jgi:cellobiose-specific phosphotransferase system component IIB
MDSLFCSCGYSSGTAIKVIQEVAAEKNQEDMILTGHIC